MVKTNKGRKFFATTATAALVASAIVPVASAAQINDFNTISSYAQDAVQDLNDRDIINGDAKGNFNPKKSVTRAEAATILTNAFDLEATKDLNFTDVKAGAWYYDAIAAAVEAGIFSGQGAGKFNPSGSLTRAEAAVILVNAFELEGKGELNFTDAKDIKAWAEEAISIAVANGILKGDNGRVKPNDAITRQDFAVMFSRAEAAVVDPAAALVKAGEDLKKATEALVEKVTAETVAAAKTAVTASEAAIKATEEALAAAVKAEVITEEQTKAAQAGIDAAKAKLEVAKKAVADYEGSLLTVSVQSVSATNLKQVVVTFNQAVDKSSASEVANYAITGSNSPEFVSASVSEDGKSVTLTLKETFSGQSEYKLSVLNIKAGTKLINEKDLVFKPLDNTVPTVAAVQGLGNKTIRVLFNEPIKTAVTSNFAIDGKVVVGSIQTTGNAVIIKLSSALTDGEHTLTAEGISDYANFKVVKADTKFNVVEDKTAPTVTSVVSASFEKVVLKFSEPVEQVFASNIYWMQGSAKKQASSVKPLADDTYEFTFTDDKKLVYTTDLYVTNVKDYSGNVIDKDTKVQVTPVIDQTRPEVISAGFVSGSSNKQIVIKFSKSLDENTAKKAANYVIKDKDGKVQYISTSVDATKDKEVTITLLNALKDNQDYTLSVTGVSDNTTLKNVILPYTTTLSVKDVTPPTFDSVTRINDKQLYVQFSEAMATSGDGSIVDSAKYTITNTSTKKTISPASFNVTGDAKGVILTFNDELPAYANISVKVQLVKDLAGNYLANLTDTKTAIDNSRAVVDTVKAVATDKVQVKFTRALQSLNQGDFKVEGQDIAHSELSADGKTATFTLKSDLPEDVLNSASPVAPLQLTVVASPSSLDVLGEKISGGIAKDIVDTIAPSVKSIVAADLLGDKIKITFYEAVTATTGSETDFVVVDNLGNEVEVVSATATSSKDLIITLNKVVAAATISAKEVRFVKDGADNAIANIEETTVELGDKAAPTATKKVSGTDTANKLDLTFSEDVQSVVINAGAKTTVADAAVTFAAATDAKAASLTSTTGATPGQKINFTITDKAGNAKTYTATFGTTTWTIAAD